VIKGRRSEKEQRSEKGGVTRNEPKGVRRSQGCRQMERELAQKEQEKVRSEKGSMLNRPINSTTNTHRTPQPVFRPRKEDASAVGKSKVGR